MSAGHAPDAASCPGGGTGEDAVAQQAEALELDRLQRAAGGALEDLELTDGLSLDRGLREILDTGTAAVPGILRRAVRSGVVLLAVVLLCGLTEEVSGALGAEQSFSGAEIAGALAVTAAAVADVHALVGLGREALDSLGNFSKVLLPTVTAAVAASGAPGAAAARQLATVLFPMCSLPSLTGFFCPWSTPMWRPVPPMLHWGMRDCGGWLN